MPNGQDAPPNPTLVALNQPGADGEIEAMNAIVDALKPLTQEERRRVLEYVLGRFGALPIQQSIPSLSAGLATLSGTSKVEAALSGSSIGHYAGHGVGAVHDIRSLKETKSPKSANEMAALVAFYVSEMAPPDEKKNTITKTDIDRYFKSAGFNIPADATFTLVNAKNAGYLDGAGGGQYKLNPVGYNLVAYRMGAREKKEQRLPRAKRAKVGAGKSANGRRKK